MSKQRLLDGLAYGVLRVLVAVIQALPVDMANSFCRTVATVLARYTRIRRKTFDANMQLIFPDSTQRERDDLCLAMWHHLMLMVCEIAWAQRRLHLANWSKIVRLQGNRLLLEHLLSDRPTVVVTGHFGNFEIGGYLLGLMGFPTVTIARRLDNPYLHRFVERFRGTHGQYMVDKEGCAPFIDRHLSQGGVLSLLADQHAGDKGCWSQFLGADASCHKALALFSMTSGAPMLVSATRRAGRPMFFDATCVAAIDPQNDPDGVCTSVKSLTQWYNDQMAIAIAPAVEQYWWVHRRWRPKPQKAAKASAAADKASAAA